MNEAHLIVYVMARTRDQEVAIPALVVLMIVDASNANIHRTPVGPARDVMKKYCQLTGFSCVKNMMTVQN